ncbi:MAG: hypothetical protein WAW61_01935 [Methylococcaceae bacterium]
MITVTLSEAQMNALQQLDSNIAHATPAIKKEVLATLSPKIITISKGHTEAQTDLKGQPYAPHKRGRQRKMLTRLANRLKIIGMRESEAIIGFNNAVEANIGYKHQYGYRQKHSASELKNPGQFRGRANLGGDAPATRKQAKSLIAAGYKVKKAGQAYRTPTIKWIVANMTIKRAGLILRLIRTTDTESWTTKLPARSFLGATEAEKTELINLALEQSTALLVDALNP